MRARSLLIEDFRKQARKDLEALNELTKLIEPPAWTKAVDITRDSIRLDGEAPSSAALVQILDGSPLFEHSEPLSSTRGANGEVFQMRTMRRPGK